MHALLVSIRLSDVVCLGYTVYILFFSYSYRHTGKSIEVSLSAIYRLAKNYYVTTNKLVLFASYFELRSCAQPVVLIEAI